MVEIPVSESTDAFRAGRVRVPARAPLAVIETHPIQYRAPVYRVLREKYNVPVHVIYGSDFSVAGYRDAEFGSTFAWDTDLVSGYEHRFLRTVANGGGRTYESVSTRGLAAALQNLNPGAILLSGYSPRFHQLAWLQALRLRRPILFRGETADRPQMSGGLRLKLRSAILGRLYSACSGLLYIGQRSRDHLIAHGCPIEKLTFSPYCVDTTPFRTEEDARRELRSSARAELRINGDDTVLLFSGKLSERKGADLILEAVRMLPETERARTVVVFMGSGKLLPDLEAAANCSPVVRACFPGFQNQTRVSRFYHAADLLILPSRRLETWGLVVNEGLHHGLPCVVSDSVGCAPDLATPGLTGEVFESESVPALVGAIKRGLLLTANAGTRQACRSRAMAYSVDKAAEGIAQAWEAAVA